MRSIGLMGYARSGKDTAGAYLVQEHGYRRIGFADGVRESLLALDPLVSAEGHACKPGGDTVRLSHLVACDGWESAKSRPEVRALLQRMGTDAVRDVINSNAWTYLAASKMERYKDVPHVVTDVRFRNEVDMLRMRGFLLVWVTRPGYVPVNAHASESAVSAADADAVVTNAGSREDLYAQIRKIVQ